MRGCLFCSPPNLNLGETNTRMCSYQKWEKRRRVFVLAAPTNVNVGETHARVSVSPIFSWHLLALIWEKHTTHICSPKLRLVVAVTKVHRENILESIFEVGAAPGGSKGD